MYSWARGNLLERPDAARPSRRRTASCRSGRTARRPGSPGDRGRGPRACRVLRQHAHAVVEALVGGEQGRGLVRVVLLLEDRRHLRRRLDDRRLDRLLLAEPPDGLDLLVDLGIDVGERGGRLRRRGDGLRSGRRSGRASARRDGDGVPVELPHAARRTARATVGRMGRRRDRGAAGRSGVTEDIAADCCMEVRGGRSAESPTSVSLS